MDRKWKRLLEDSLTPATKKMEFSNAGDEQIGTLMSRESSRR